MDNVKAVTKWQDGAGMLHDTEEEAQLAEARRIACNILRNSTNFRTQVIDIDNIALHWTKFADAMDKIRKGLGK